MNAMLKLFVWEDVLKDYTAGVIFALAENVDEARELVLATHGEYVASETGKEPQVFDSPVAFASWGGG